MDCDLTTGSGWFWRTAAAQRNEVRAMVMLGLFPCNSGPTVVMRADKKRPRQVNTSTEVHSSKSLITVDRLGSTKPRNIGPLDSAVMVSA